MRLLLGSVLVLLVACTEQPVIVPSLTIATAPQQLTSGGTTRVSRFRTDSLFIRLVTPRLADTGPSWVTFRFVTPSGATFKTVHLAYSADPAERSTPSRTGGPPAVVQPASPIAGGFALVAEVPVGGGAFERHGIAGTWQLVAQLDGVRAIHAELPFEVVDEW